MRAVVVDKHGGPEVLQVSDWPAPRPVPAQLLVNVSASGVNFMDIYQREGRPPYGGGVPYVPGAEGAGTVTAAGLEGPGFAAGGRGRWAGGPRGCGCSGGDRVAWPGVPGSCAEQAVTPADRAVPVPGGVELEVAAAVMLQGMTAHYLSRSTYPGGRAGPPAAQA